MPAETTYQKGDKFVRLISVFDQLLTTNTGRTTQELADDLGADQRTVQRYLKQMREAGVDLTTDAGGRHTIGADSKLPQMQFSKHEAVTLLIALRLLQQMKARQDPALAAAVARLAKAMRIETVVSYLGTMLESLEAQPEGDAAQVIESTVIRCFVDRIPCEIQYANAQGETSKRVLRVYFLEPRPESRTIYVYALDAKSNEMRVFRMDRISGARDVLIEGQYEIPENFDIADVTKSSWGVWQAGDELQEVVLRFAPSATARVRQSTWHPSAQLTDIAGGGVEMRLQVASEIEMRPWVLGWGSQVEVVAPESMRVHIAESMRKGARMYDTQVSSG